MSYGHSANNLMDTKPNYATANQGAAVDVSSGPLFGLVCFEEPGMPWTRVRGRYKLLRQDNGEVWDGEPHWEIELEKGDTCFVPASSVVILPNTKTTDAEATP